MADEPVICLDGDKAGAQGREPRDRHRAAACSSRASRSPSRCCRTGRTRTTSPARAARQAIAEVLGRGAAARRHALEARGRGRPARYAGAARRLRAPAEGAARPDRDETTRKHYRREMDERLAQLFASAAPARPERGREGGGFQRGRGGGSARGGARSAVSGRPGVAGPLKASSQLTQSRDAWRSGAARTRARPSSCWRWRRHPESDPALCRRDRRIVAATGRAAERFRQALLDAARSTLDRRGAGESRWRSRASRRRGRHLTGRSRGRRSGCKLAQAC